MEEKVEKIELLDNNNYKITRDGRIWSEKIQNFLKFKNTPYGYRIELSINKIPHDFNVGKVIYAACHKKYLKELEDYHVIYKNGNIYDNNINNLKLERYKAIEEKGEVKDIPGYEGLYAATKDGRIWSCRNKIFLKPSIKKDFKCEVNLHKDGKTKYYAIHRLVMMTWCPCENMDKMQVNHKDENRLNNSLDNLEWCTGEYNINYGTRNVRTAEKLKKKVRCIETGQIFDSQMEVAKFLGQKSQSNISSCLSGRQKTCGGYHWERIE